MNRLLESVGALALKTEHAMTCLPKRCPNCTWTPLALSRHNALLAYWYCSNCRQHGESDIQPFNGAKALEQLKEKYPSR